MWDPNIGLGTVTHQNIGYLFPMGPYYWVLDRRGFPDWVAQRLWLGSLLFFAGLGVLYLLRTLDVRGPGRGRCRARVHAEPVLPALRGPHLGDPAAVGRAAVDARAHGPRSAQGRMAISRRVRHRRADRRQRERDRARVRAASRRCCGSRTRCGSRARSTGGELRSRWPRIGVLTLGASLWWISGLWAQGGYGLDILRYTETVKTVATAGVAPEVLRGLGYWFFYGGDKLGHLDRSQRRLHAEPSAHRGELRRPDTGAARGGVHPLASPRLLRVLMLVGVVIAVGAHPFDDPSPFGARLKAFADESTAGLALRSIGRAVPLVALGAAVLLGAGVTAFVRWLDRRDLHRYALVTIGVVGALVIAALPALWNGDFYGKNLQRPEDVPSYWTRAIAAVDARPHDTRVLELPGLRLRVVPLGEHGRPDHARADGPPLRRPRADPVRLARVGRPAERARPADPGGPARPRRDRADRPADERGRHPRCATTCSSSATTSSARSSCGGSSIRRRGGSATPTGYGTSLGPPLDYPLLDEQALGAAGRHSETRRRSRCSPSRTRRRSCARSRRPTRWWSPATATAWSTSPASACSTGTTSCCTRRRTPGTPPSSASRPATDGAVLVVTDSNRRRARRWSTVRENVGYTERPGEKPLVHDPSDARLDVFPGAGDDSYTVTEQRGATVQASAYGNPISYTPEDRPARAIDGDLRTAWKAGDFDAVDGERIRVTLDQPVTTDHVDLVQPLTATATAGSPRRRCASTTVTRSRRPGRRSHAPTPARPSRSRAAR